MIALLRAAGLGAGALLVWMVIASQVPSHVRLPMGAVVPGARVSQPFGCTSLELEPFDPFCPGRHVHTGVDLAAPIGSAVHSATAGTAHVGFDPEGAGRYVLVTAAAHVRVFYGHLSVIGVAEGQAVSAGQVIGEVGATGRATGAHVHFEVQVDGRSVDPEAWLAS
ncbi:M23 family metallopeptidase [bacterium]|nr:MAG: M23 family metallopeptidase [bacterium]